ncbi:MAG: hypothetical protein LBT50_02800, partial [Prevotellaceae bacterium]|nr:hypothetical protein [Prevotellaceae bacterium]
LRGKHIHTTGMSENGKYLAFNCMAGNRDYYAVFYDKENKKVYDTKNIDFDGFKLAECSVFGADESLYCVLRSEITDEDKKKIKNSSAFSETDKKILLEHKFDDNPVILVLK